MLPSFYQTFLEKYLTPSQLITLKMLVWLLQNQKQVKIERLAATLPLPIQHNSRRRHLQRFLTLKAISVVLLWFPLIQEILHRQIKPGSQLVLAMDRTQWTGNNILMVSAIYRSRALPIFWVILDKKGASNLAEQQQLLRPVIRLLKSYKLILIGDREFHSIELARWLQTNNISFVFRLPSSTTFRPKRRKFQPLKSISLSPGERQFYADINLTQKRGFGKFNLAVYWKRKYRGKQSNEAWYLLTNLSSWTQATKVYGQRFGIEAMFRDCKTGGYNLSGSQANSEKLTRLIFLIALAMTSAWLHGQRTQSQRQSDYICRSLQEARTRRRHSAFWIGLYGANWIVAFHECRIWVEELIGSVPNKQSFYRQGLKAIKFIEQAL